MVAINYGGILSTFVMDPDVIQDIYIGRGSKIIQKTSVQNGVFGPSFLIGTFNTMPTNDKWRSHRKSISHMFFKKNLFIMVDVFKQHMNIASDKWMA